MSKPLFAGVMLDAVPEMYHYEDTGCEVSPSCLNCPLPQCKYDDPVWFQRYRRMGRDMKVWRTINSESLTAEEAARRFSVTVRTVFRIMRRCRETIPGMDVEEIQAFAAD
jgi:hypothetical protein